MAGQTGLKDAAVLESGRRSAAGQHAQTQVTAPGHGSSCPHVPRGQVQGPSGPSLLSGLPRKPHSPGCPESDTHRGSCECVAGGGFPQARCKVTPASRLSLSGARSGTCLLPGAKAGSSPAPLCPGTVCPSQRLARATGFLSHLNSGAASCVCHRGALGLRGQGQVLGLGGKERASGGPRPWPPAPHVARPLGAPTCWFRNHEGRLQARQAL